MDKTVLDKKLTMLLRCFVLSAVVQWLSSAMAAKRKSLGDDEVTKPSTKSKACSTHDDPQEDSNDEATSLIEALAGELSPSPSLEAASTPGTDAVEDPYSV